MQIWINKITGQVDIINGLNHYIGMKFIKEEMFPELKYMPYIVGAIIAFCLITAVVGRKYFLVIFALIIVSVGVAGAVDFFIYGRMIMDITWIRAHLLKYPE